MNAFGYIKCAARTDVGRKRKNNEDAFGKFPKAGIFCVADGMGGGDDGEIASAAVVKAVEDAAALCEPPAEGGYDSSDVAEVLERGLSKASEWIFNRTTDKKLVGCGSTFVGVVLDATRPDSALAVHAGDSRLYLLHGRSIKQITRDHSVSEMMGVKDESKVNPMFRSMVMNAVGIKPKVDLELTPFKVAEGDRIVICSDGLSRMVPDKQILAISRKNKDIGEAVEALIASALEAGGVDNVTVVAVEIGELPPPVESLPLPAAEAGFMDDDTDTGSTDGTEEADTEGNTQTIQTVIPTTVMHHKIDLSNPQGGRISVVANVGHSEESRWMSAGSRRWWIVGAVILAFVVIAVVIFMLAKKGRDGDGGGMGGAPRPAVAVVATNEVAAVQEVATNEVAAVQEVATTEVAAVQAVATDEVAAVQAVATNEAVAVQAVATNVIAAGAERDKRVAPVAETGAKRLPRVEAERPVCTNLAVACEASKVSVFISKVKRLFPEGQVPYDYTEQMKHLQTSARECARMRTAKTIQVAAVDLKFALLSAESARKAFAAQSPDGAGKAWLSDWSAIVSGDPKDIEVQEACARLIGHVEEVLAK